MATPAAATGNAFRLLLPAGTTITLPDDNASRQVQAVAVNELDLARSNGRSVTLARPLQLVSPAYVAQRDAAEFSALREVKNLQDENSRLRK